MDFTEETATGAVVASFAGTPDPRLRELLGSLVRHLHGFVREVEPTFEEWERAVEFLAATGRMCDDQRQEFILLSDVLGVTMLVDAINHRKASEATESTVLGPFHMVESPPRELGDTIDLVATGQPCVVTGQVARSTAPRWPAPWSTSGRPTTTASTTSSSRAASPPATAGACSPATSEGRFWFRTVTPSAYPIPTDGPVGGLLTATGRHPYRPAHIHFIVAAGGHLPVTTHVFVAGSPYLDSDAVFAVKQSLVRDFTEVDDPDQAAAYGVEAPFRHASFDVVLQPAG